MKKKVSYHTLGCKLNFAETSTISREFSENGFEKVKFGENANVVVINTCSVTGIADKKCRAAIKKAKKTSPDAFIVVTGCYAQLQPKEISKIEGVDLVLGANDKFNIFEYSKQFQKFDKPQIYSCEINEVEKFQPAFSSGDRTRSFLKIQDGCDYPCTYCTIPKARGKSRNKNIKSIVDDAYKIANEGYKEIILTGVNIGDFGKSTGETFFDLIKVLDKVKGIERYRISSIEPNLITDEIIDFTEKSAKFLPHFHIPLQSGSDKLLKLMKRRYLTDIFVKKINKINDTIKNVFIGIDVIVGFPGETDEDFNDTYKLLESLKISFIHVFSYSERPGTPAADMKNKVSKDIIKQRSQKLHKLSEIKHRNFCENNIGNKSKVLLEAAKHENMMFGFTENYIKIKIPYNKKLVNTIVEHELIPDIFADFDFKN